MHARYDEAHPRRRTRDLTTAALVVSLLAASAWIVIPLGAVPVTLQVLLVVLAGLLLSPGWTAAAVGLYLALGTLGLPVFAGGKAGLGVLLGPTGGYLVGFLVGGTIGAALRVVLVRRGLRAVAADSVAATVIVTVTYLLGTTQLAFNMLLGAGEALALGVVPFIGPDIAKAVVAVGVAQAVRRALGT